VEADVAYGKQNGIHGTPTVFLNGQQINVADAEQLRGAIRKVTGVPAATN
jgi:protein-disulfide isomerase